MCPWFPQEGRIDGKRWGRGEDCLQDFYKVLGLKKAPAQAFSYWNLVSDVLSVHDHSLDIQKVVKEGEKVL